MHSRKYIDSFLREFEKLSGMQPGSLNQQLAAKGDSINPLLLAKLMSNREESMSDVQGQFNSLFTKHSAKMDPNLKPGITGISGKSMTDVASNYDRTPVETIAKAAPNLYQSVYDTTPASTGASTGASTIPNSSVSLMPANKSKPGKGADGMPGF